MRRCVYNIYFNKSSILEKRDLNRNDRFIQYGLVAAKMAIDDAGLENMSEEQKLRIGVSVGSGIGGLETIYEGSLTINNKEPKKLSPFFIPSSLVTLNDEGKLGIKSVNKNIVKFHTIKIISDSGKGYWIDARQFSFDKLPIIDKGHEFTVEGEVVKFLKND